MKLQGVPGHKRHPPGIVSDILRGAHGGEAGPGEFLDHFIFA